jgi:hypothetical protein
MTSEPVEFLSFLRSIKELTLGPPPPRLQTPEPPPILTGEEEKRMREKMGLFRTNE